MKEILKLEKKKSQKMLPVNKKHNTLEKMHSWGGEGVATKTDKVVSVFFETKRLQNKQTKNKTKQKQIGKRKGAEKERGGLLE